MTPVPALAEAGRHGGAARTLPVTVNEAIGSLAGARPREPGCRPRCGRERGAHHVRGASGGAGRLGATRSVGGHRSRRERGDRRVQRGEAPPARHRAARSSVPGGAPVETGAAVLWPGTQARSRARAGRREPAPGCRPRRATRPGRGGRHGEPPGGRRAGRDPGGGRLPGGADRRGPDRAARDRGRVPDRAGDARSAGRPRVATVARRAPRSAGILAAHARMKHPGRGIQPDREPDGDVAGPPEGAGAAGPFHARDARRERATDHRADRVPEIEQK